MTDFASLSLQNCIRMTVMLNHLDLLPIGTLNKKIYGYVFDFKSCLIKMNHQIVTNLIKLKKVFLKFYKLVWKLQSLSNSLIND